MQVQWTYEGIRFRHTTDEVDDPECHTWQGPVDGAELIVHAANLHLYRSGAERPLWSLRRKAGRSSPRTEFAPECNSSLAHSRPLCYTIATDVS